MAISTLFAIALLPLLTASTQAGAGDDRAAGGLLYGSWDAWLESPGGRLRFGLELQKGEGGPVAFLRNGVERIEVPDTRLEGGELVLDFPHYDSRVTAQPNGNGTRLEGLWRKRRTNVAWVEMKFTAVARPPGGMPAVGSRAAEQVAGRWAVDFSGSSDPAVGVFEAQADGGVRGTFLTALGDYRFLAGRFEKSQLELSCFDGAHAFLFHAWLGDDGTLAGDFWSRDKWHETWTASRDDDAQLADPFGINEVRPGAELESLKYPDLDGVVRALGDEAFAGKARIVQLFGSWCPNCNDEAPVLNELYERYGPRGLSIVGLGFELTGDVARDTEQLRRYRDRWNVKYPLLLAGTANKAAASFRFPYLDRVVAYPTTIFLGADGRARAIHTGFSGPAAGPEHAQLRERFEALVEELLTEADEASR